MANRQAALKARGASTQPLTATYPATKPLPSTPAKSKTTANRHKATETPAGVAGRRQRGAGIEAGRLCVLFRSYRSMPTATSDTLFDFRLDGPHASTCAVSRLDRILVSHPFLFGELHVSHSPTSAARGASWNNDGMSQSADNGRRGRRGSAVWRLASTSRDAAWTNVRPIERANRAHRSHEGKKALDGHPSGWRHMQVRPSDANRWEPSGTNRAPFGNSSAPRAAPRC